MSGSWSLPPGPRHRGPTPHPSLSLSRQRSLATQTLMVSLSEVSTSVQSQTLAAPQSLASSQRCEQSESLTPCPSDTQSPDAHSSLFFQRSASLALPSSLSLMFGGGAKSCPSGVRSDE